MKLVLEDYAKETLWLNLYVKQLCPHVRKHLYPHHVNKQLCPHHVHKQLCPHHVHIQQQNKTYQEQNCCICISTRQPWIANS